METGVHFTNYYKINIHAMYNKQLTVEGDGITVGTRLLSAIRMSDVVRRCTCQHVERVGFHCERRSSHVNATS